MDIIIVQKCKVVQTCANISKEAYDDEKLLNEFPNTLDDSTKTDSLGNPIPETSYASSPTQSLNLSDLCYGGGVNQISSSRNLSFGLS